MVSDSVYLEYFRKRLEERLKELTDGQKAIRPGEDLYVAMGQADSGRYLVVFFIRKFPNIALILSARDMDRKERKRYERT